MCLVCGEQISEFKEYSLNWIYETKHTEKALLATLQKNQGFFFFF